MFNARNATSLTLTSMALLAIGTILSGPVSSLAAADIAEATELFNTGQYVQCATTCHQAISAGEYSVTWRMLKIRSEMAIGSYPAALETLEKALKRFRTSVRLRWLGETVYRMNGIDDRAASMLDEIDKLTRGASWRYSDPLSRVTLGRYFLRRGADPKQVLDAVYSEVKNRTRSFTEPFIAAGELALEKHDYALAAEEYEAALRLDALSADVHFGLAKAYASSDSEKAEQHLKSALQRNPHHLDSLLFLVNSHLDAERYDDVRELLDLIMQFRSSDPRAWSYRAVLAHLENDPVSEEVCRKMALSWWTTNPEVDTLIGSKLSQKYRFEEGASYQRRALDLDPDYLPAKIALSQDLLRLGREEQGWQLADEVYADDGYNVVAHNLITLKDKLAEYRTLRTPHFLVRMEAREAEIYGERVVDLLTDAKTQLCAKYNIELDDPILVEIFPQQQDFAIRTFGLPGGTGFLGVCFGAVITANSPASQSEHPANWQSVLWHEYCHVVTLHKTKNKMPRWLSEGISVYEEREADPTWGQTMTPQYREMILGGELTPVSQLSAAFLEPESPLHLQFAYFESSMVVEFLVENYGFETLERVLVDLGVGMPINESLQRYTGSLSGLDNDFAKYAEERARALAPALNWERSEFPAAASVEDLERWNKMHPDNYWGLLRWANLLLAAEQWTEAKAPLQRIIELFPEDATAYASLAIAQRESGDVAAEQLALENVATRTADATPAYLRLMELYTEQQDWPRVLTNAERMLAVNPLVRPPHRYLTQAAEALEDDAQAVGGLRVLALMDPHDPADIHFRLATRLLRLGQTSRARRHVLMALEEAPRFRAAQQKLLEIRRQTEENEDSAAALGDPPVNSEEDS